MGKINWNRVMRVQPMARVNGQAVPKRLYTGQS
jgi:hypothetical protein